MSPLNVVFNSVPLQLHLFKHLLIGFKPDTENHRMSVLFVAFTTFLVLQSKCNFTHTPLKKTFEKKCLLKKMSIGCIANQTSYCISVMKET